MVKNFTPPTKDQIIAKYGLTGDTREARRLENYWRRVAKGGEGDSDVWYELTSEEAASKVWSESYDHARYELGPKIGIHSFSVASLDCDVSVKRTELARQEFVDRMWGRTTKEKE